MLKRIIPYSRQTIDEADIKEVVKVLKSDFITQGPKILEFETAVARATKARYAVAFSSGTAALHGAYAAAGIGPGDDVIMSPLTFVATANMVVAIGGNVVFADIDPKSGNLDPRDVERKITHKTRAIVPIDYAGLPADLEAFQRLAKKHRLVLIEDAAQALGATYKKKPIGTQADMTMFSFHAVKSITTGEGGVVTTNNKTYYEKTLLFRTHGITKDHTKLVRKDEAAWYHEMHKLGFNYRLTDIQAALGVSQMRKLKMFIKMRTDLANRYTAMLRPLKHFILPEKFPDRTSAWHLYVVRVVSRKKNARDFAFNALRNSGVGVQVHYIPVYEHPFYKRLGYKSGTCPHAEAFSAAAISLPQYPMLSLGDQDKVISILKKIDKIL